jgi:hypothetical protein
MRTMRRLGFSALLLAVLALGCHPDKTDSPQSSDRDQIVDQRIRWPWLASTVGRTESKSIDMTSPARTVCEVHGIPLQVGLARIRYGLPGRQYLRERDEKWRLFPNANLSVLGGCEPKVAAQMKISYCPECRKGEAAWDAEHDRKAAKSANPPN